MGKSRSRSPAARRKPATRKASVSPSPPRSKQSPKRAGKTSYPKAKFPKMNNGDPTTQNFDLNFIIY